VLESFEPYEREDSERPPYCVSLRYFLDFQKNRKPTAVSALQARATVEAALHVTGLNSVYKLSKHFGPKPFDPARQTATEWASGRSKLVDWWRSGQGTMRRDDGTVTTCATNFISNLRVKHGTAVEDLFNRRLWRLLDPAPLSMALLADLDRAPRLNLQRHPVHVKQAWSPQGIHAYSARVLQLVADARTRLDALEELWLIIRSARQLDALPVYVLCYTIWLSAMPILREDAVFGALVADMYAHAQRHFAQVRLFPSNGDSIVETVRLFYESGIAFACDDGDHKRLVVLDWLLVDLLVPQGGLIQEDRRYWPKPTHPHIRW